MSENPILVICPARDDEAAGSHRIADLLECCDTFIASSDRADMLIYVDDDQRDRYEQACDWGTRYGNRIRLVFGPHVGMTVLVNNIAHRFRDPYTIYGIATDDSRFITVGWDDYVIEVMDAFPNRVGVLSATHNCGDYVNFPYVSREWIEAAGWFACPDTFRFCWDSVIEILGECSNAIVYADPARFSMIHHQIPRALTHSTYIPDAHAFLVWCVGQRRATVKRIRDRIAGIA